MKRLSFPLLALLFCANAHSQNEHIPYACDDGDRFTAAFSADSAGLTRAMLRIAGREITLPQVPAPSGALYRNAGITLHTKGDDATFDDGQGKLRRCTRADLAPPAAVDQPPAAGGFIDITGSVSYRTRNALPPDAVLVVRVQDTSRADAPAVTLAEQRIELAGQQVPIPFSLLVDRDLLRKKARITVAARIQRGSKLLFINDTSHPALADGQPRQADMVLKQVSGARAP